MELDRELDAGLLARAQEETGLRSLPDLLEEALRALLEREAIKGLIALGGSMPDLDVPPRRRSEPA